MNPVDFHRYVLVAAMQLFEHRLLSPEAQAMIIAIGLQESQFLHRQQLVGGNRKWWQSVHGPAVSFFQFEKIGIEGVLEHHASRDMATSALIRFGYPSDVKVIHEALKHNDLLAAVFARLALYRYPESLPDSSNPDEGWDQYLAVWRPGKPHPERWDDNFSQAWDVIRSGRRAPIQ